YADHRALEQKDEHAKRLDLPVHRLPGAQERQRSQKGGQNEKEQTDAIDAEEVADAERGNPRMMFRELKLAGSGIESAPKQERLCENEKRDDERNSLDHLVVGFIIGNQRQHDRADDG